MSSLRGRVLLGAVLWTVGLVAVLGLALPLLFGRRAPGGPPHVIHLFASPAIVLHSTTLILLAAACMAAGLVMVRGALAPFDHFRSRLAGVQKGLDRRLGGSYPAEVQPLVDDLNALLAHGEEAVARATAKAGDLAHGLKTPLAVLSAEADRLAGGANAELASMIRQQVEKMRRQVEYHLAHARAAASGTALHTNCSIADSAEALRRTLLRLHAPRGLSIETSVAPAHAFRGRREDLDEMLGNLLDNACKWAKSRIAVESSAENGRVIIGVDDDGPGIAPAMRAAVLQRGVRADEAAPGSGLGLAIVRDLAELYCGSISLESSPWGGVRAKLELPSG